MKSLKGKTSTLLVSSLLIYTTLWFVERWLFENILEKTFQKSFENGIKVSYGNLIASGYPDNLVFHLQSVNIKVKDLFEINTPGVTIRAGLFFPFKQSFQVDFESLPQGAFLKDFRFTASQVGAKFFLQKMRIYGIEIAADSLFVSYKQWPAAKMKSFRVSLTDLGGGGVPLLQVGLHSHVEGWFRESLLLSTAFFMDAEFDLSHYDVFLNSPYPFQAWYNKSGSLAFKNCHISGQLINFYGVGSLRLDDGLFPEGKIILKIQGIEAFLSFIQKNFYLTHEEISWVRLGLGAGLEKDPQGHLLVPLDVRGGKASLWGIPLFRVLSLR